MTGLSFWYVLSTRWGGRRAVAISLMSCRVSILALAYMGYDVATANRPSGHGRRAAQQTTARAAGMATVAQIWRVASVGAMWRAYAMPAYAPAV